ncbi:MAG: hypothetical protein KKA05_07760 [Alphaproteobacteria bacterium]|nr:hypothetical protein [Alphaproteobacteria bacterium]MBU0858369.1 hypothetical protein [Alphaproteobacteria bacterium]
MHINRIFGRLLGIMVLVSAASSTQAQDAKINGLYCHKATVEFSSPSKPDGTCDAPMAKVEGINFCRGTKRNSQTLQIRVNADNTMDFGVSVWQGDYNCGLSGKAVKQGKSWRFEKYINDPDVTARCRVDIAVTKDNILVFRTDPAASCRYACGAGIGLDGVSFPLNKSRIGPVQDVLFESQEYIYTAQICPR